MEALIIIIYSSLFLYFMSLLTKKKLKTKTKKLKTKSNKKKKRREKISSLRFIMWKHKKGTRKVEVQEWIPIMKLFHSIKESSGTFPSSFKFNVIRFLIYI